MTESSTAQRRTIAVLSERLFGVRSCAVELAGSALELHRGSTVEKATRLIKALRQVEKEDPVDPEARLVELLGGDLASIPSIPSVDERLQPRRGVDLARAAASRGRNGAGG